MIKTCDKCQIQFEITEEDLKFYSKFSVLPPVICHNCREQRRLAIRNERSLYRNSCSLCKKGIISIYSKDKPYPVFCQECFWGDSHNPLDHGRDFDFDKPFFKQFAELINEVPRLSIVNKQSENSDYCNYSFTNKNCYLTFGNHYEEDCSYGQYSTKNKDCVDYLWLYKSELCYECSFSKKCYRSVYLDHSEECQECYFSIDLKGCKNCLFSSNLRHKEFYIFNKQYSKIAYLSKLEELKLNTYQGFQKAKELFFDEVKIKFPARNIYQVNSENATGSDLENCKNLKYCFDCTGCEDCSYGAQMDETYDSMDLSCMGYDRSEECYETIGCSALFNSLCCDSCWQDNDLKYCQLCFSSKDCFGCIGLKHKQYCILNKQYTKEEYEELLPRIIQKLKTENVYGEFFPIGISPFKYNETVANDFYPMTKEEIFGQGYLWQEKDEVKTRFITSEQENKSVFKIPENIFDVGNEILEKVLKCD